VILLRVSEKLVVLKTEVSEGVIQEIPLGGSQQLQFLAPGGERIAVTVKPRGSKASFVVDAPATVVLIRGELEAGWTRSCPASTGRCGLTAEWTSS